MDEFQVPLSPSIPAEFLYDDDLIYHRDERIFQSEELWIQHLPQELVLDEPSHAIQVTDQSPQEVIHHHSNDVHQSGQLIQQPGKVMQYPFQEIVHENSIGEGVYKQPPYLPGTGFIDQPPQEVIHPTEVVHQSGQFIQLPGQVMHYPLQDIIQENSSGKGAYEQPPYPLGTGFIHQPPQEAIHYPTEAVHQSGKFIQQPGQVMHYSLQEIVQQISTTEGAYEQPPYPPGTGFIDQPPQEVIRPTEVVHQSGQFIQQPGQGFIHQPPQEAIHYPTEAVHQSGKFIQQPGQVMHYSLQEIVQQISTREGAYEQPPYPPGTGFIDQPPQEVIRPTEVVHQSGQFIQQPGQGFIDQPPQEVIHYSTEVVHQSGQFTQQPGQVMHHPPQEINQKNPTGEEAYRQPPYPPGVRFAPTDAELLEQYLTKKIHGEPIPRKIINEEDVYRGHPEDIVETHKDSGETAWYFFTPRDRRYGRGRRPRRDAGPGYWKASGSDKEIHNSSGVQIGSKRHLVYHVGRQQARIKTNWMMYEYKVQDSQIPLDPNPKVKIMLLDTWVLCKIYKKVEKTEDN
ncbi:uncharacterized protein [Typha latifolia]|uniref:uncharacterized protein n=1 Tax=Typha latifolia TaxID=4733 RepID=UPI003C2F7FF0